MATTAAAGGKRKKNRTKNKSKNTQNTLFHSSTNPQQNSQNTLTNSQENLKKVIEKAASATTAAYTFLSENDLRLHPSQALTLESKISTAALSLTKLHLSVSQNNNSTTLSSSSSSSRPCWFDRFLSDADDDYDTRWTECFRMSKPSFTLLLRLLTPSLSSLTPLPPNYALAAALFRLAHSATYKSVGNRFGIDSPTACLAFHTVCKAIIDNLSHLFEFKSDINRVVVGFGWISLPNCCGILGFDRFKVEGNLFGENGYVMVQALVDSEGRFLDVSAGWPSHVKPESILRQSEFYSRVEDSKELLNGTAFKLNGGNFIPQYILGESCLPVLPWLITPFAETDVMDEDRRAFNLAHKRATELIDTAFRRVRNQWQLLTKEWKEGCVEALPFVIVASCLLHNFLIKCSEPLADNNVDYTTDFELPIFEGEVDETGSRIREVLAAHLSRIRGCSAMWTNFQLDATQICDNGRCAEVDLQAVDEDDLQGNSLVGSKQARKKLKK